MHDYNLIVCLFICVCLCVIIISVECEYFIHYFACKMCIAMYTTTLIILILYLFYFQIWLCGVSLGMGMVLFNFLLSFILCKYLSTYFFLTHIPSQKCKLNLYLPLPIPFQIIHVCDFVRVPRMPTALVHQKSHTSKSFVLCKYLSTYLII